MKDDSIVFRVEGELKEFLKKLCDEENVTLTQTLTAYARECILRERILFR